MFEIHGPYTYVILVGSVISYALKTQENREKSEPENAFEILIRIPCFQIKRRQLNAPHLFTLTTKSRWSAVHGHPHPILPPVGHSTHCLWKAGNRHLRGSQTTPNYQGPRSSVGESPSSLSSSTSAKGLRVRRSVLPGGRRLTRSWRWKPSYRTFTGATSGGRVPPLSAPPAPAIAFGAGGGFRRGVREGPLDGVPGREGNP